MLAFIYPFKHERLIQTKSTYNDIPFVSYDPKWLAPFRLYASNIMTLMERLTNLLNLKVQLGIFSLKSINMKYLDNLTLNYRDTMYIRFFDITCFH